MLGFKGKCTIGIDLAGLSKYPTGWALLKDNAAKTSLVYTDSEILENIARNGPSLIAIEAVGVGEGFQHQFTSKFTF